MRSPACSTYRQGSHHMFRRCSERMGMRDHHPKSMANPERRVGPTGEWLMWLMMSVGLRTRRKRRRRAQRANVGASRFS